MHLRHPTRGRLGTRASAPGRVARSAAAGSPIPAVGAVLALLLVGACNADELLTGTATVVDGDSLTIGPVSVRLYGIDAPEGTQTCRRDGAAWNCGEAAAAELRRLVTGRRLSCEPKDVDTYGRIVAVCRAGERELNEHMVRSGLALAYRRFGDDYVPAEEAAHGARRGLWSGRFTAPWDYRQDNRRESATAARVAESAGCDIKGNISRNGRRIYHVPGSPSYRQTVIDTSRGERWFCSAEQARQAGWRAPR